MDNNKNEEPRDPKGKKIIYVSLVISIILFTLALFLYFNSNPVEYNPSLSNSNVDLENKYIEQARKNVYDKDMSNALIVKNKINDEILRYKKNARKFADDFLDVGSSVKTIWYKIGDFFRTEEEKVTDEYIKNLYYQYMFDENDIAKIIEDNIEYFNSLHSQALNTEINSLTNKLMKLNLSPTYIKELLESEFNVEININDLSESVQVEVLLNSTLSSTPFFDTDTIVKALTENLFRIVRPLLAEGIGEAFSFSIPIGGFIINRIIRFHSKRKITREINEKIEDIAKTISEEVYNKIILTIQ